MSSTIEPSTARPPKLERFARELIKRGSKSFSGASRMFGNELRNSASLLYAWCRYCDDVVDDQILGQGEAGSTETIDARLATLSQQTRDAIAGNPDGEAFEALAWVVQTHEIPERYPLELLQGFAMDARDHQYETIEDTLLYSYHVAGVVGVMMAMIMGARHKATLRRACDLGIAFQLTNIARDVVEDAGRGRIYLPAAWLREAGVAADPKAVLDDANHEAVYSVVLRLLDCADAYYRSARYGLPRLPFRCACAIGAARVIYRDIGNIIRDSGASILNHRAVVSKRRKYLDAFLGVSTACRAYGVDRFRNAPPRSGLWTHAGLRDAAMETR